MKQKTKIIFQIGFVLYVIVMLWLLFGQRIGHTSPYTYWERFNSNYNFIPFFTVWEFIQTATNSVRPYLIWQAIINIVGNIVMFVPLGFFIPYFWTKQRPFWRSMLCAAVCIVVVEIVQLFTLLGSCDIDDLILNMLGVVIGYGVYRIAILLFAKIEMKK